MIDLRPPYKWEKQPEKPKEESGFTIVLTIVSLLMLYRLLMIAGAG